MEGGSRNFSEQWQQPYRCVCDSIVANLESLGEWVLSVEKG